MIKYSKKQLDKALKEFKDDCISEFEKRGFRIIQYTGEDSYGFQLAFSESESCITLGYADKQTNDLLLSDSDWKFKDFIYCNKNNPPDMTTNISELLLEGDDDFVKSIFTTKINTDSMLMNIHDDFSRVVELYMTSTYIEGVYFKITVSSVNIEVAKDVFKPLFINREFKQNAFSSDYVCEVGINRMKAIDVWV